VSALDKLTNPNARRVLVADVRAGLQVALHETSVSADTMEMKRVRVKKLIATATEAIGEANVADIARHWLAMMAQLA